MYTKNIVGSVLKVPMCVLDKMQRASELESQSISALSEGNLALVDAVNIR
jgi:hypothetical protein